jgi:hypothetical protein
MKEYLKALPFVIGLSICLGCTIVMLMMYILGSQYNWIVEVHMNDFNEAIPEFIVLVVGIILTVYGVIQLIMDKK